MLSLFSPARQMDKAHMVRLNRLKVRRPKGTDGRHNVNGGFGDGGRGGNLSSDAPPQTIEKTAFTRWNDANPRSKYSVIKPPLKGAKISFHSHPHPESRRQASALYSCRQVWLFIIMAIKAEKRKASPRVRGHAFLFYVISVVVSIRVYAFLHFIASSLIPALCFTLFR